MASTFKLKRKTFSDSENKGSGWGKKLLVGAGIAAAGFAGAKKGMFGAGAQKWAGSTYAKAGKMLGSQGMLKSGAASYGQGAAKQASAKAVSNGGTAFSKEQLSNIANKKANQLESVLTKVRPDAATKAANKSSWLAKSQQPKPGQLLLT